MTPGTDASRRTAAVPETPADAGQMPASQLRATLRARLGPARLGLRWRDPAELARQQAAESRARACAWCQDPIPERARSDAVTCSKRCRQARHRFLRAAGYAESVTGRPLRLAYADPPYPGNSRLYRDHPDYGGEVDHAALIARLAAYDGWALSTSAEALPAVLALCPPGARVAAWHRGERPTRSRWPLHAWEPVIYSGGRQLPDGQHRTDSIVCGVSAVTTLPGRVTGAKPPAVCRWIFTLLGAGPQDTLDDLFPGSGAVSRAWAAFTRTPEPSHPAARDASFPARADASAPVPRDVSLPAACDASAVVVRDS